MIRRLVSSHALTTAHIIMYGFEHFVQEYVAGAIQAAALGKPIPSYEFRPMNEENRRLAQRDAVANDLGSHHEPSDHIIHVRIIEDEMIWRAVSQIFRSNAKIDEVSGRLYLELTVQGDGWYPRLNMELIDEGPEARLAFTLVQQVDSSRRIAVA